MSQFRPQEGLMSRGRDTEVLVYCPSFTTWSSVLLHQVWDDGGDDVCVLLRECGNRSSLLSISMASRLDSLRFLWTVQIFPQGHFLSLSVEL